MEEIPPGGSWQTSLGSLAPETGLVMPFLIFHSGSGNEPFVLSCIRNPPSVPSVDGIFAQAGFESTVLLETSNNGTISP